MAPMTPKNMLLVDGLGACLSAVCLGGVLPALQAHVGMPKGVLFLLAAIAALFALNSLLAHRFAGRHAATWLRGVLAANLLYCVLTGSLLAIHRSELTPLGVAYFVAEILIVLGLAGAERASLRAEERAQRSLVGGAG